MENEETAQLLKEYESSFSSDSKKNVSWVSGGVETAGSGSRHLSASLKKSERNIAFYILQ